MAERVTRLEAEVEELHKRAPDVELRLRNIEKTINIGLGAVLLLQVLLKFIPIH